MCRLHIGNRPHPVCACWRRKAKYVVTGCQLGGGRSRIITTFFSHVCDKNDFDEEAQARGCVCPSYTMRSLQKGRGGGGGGITPISPVHQQAGQTLTRVPNKWGHKLLPTYFNFNFNNNEKSWSLNACRPVYSTYLECQTERNPSTPAGLLSSDPKGPKYIYHVALSPQTANSTANVTIPTPRCPDQPKTPPKKTTPEPNPSTSTVLAHTPHPSSFILHQYIAREVLLYMNRRPNTPTHPARSYPQLHAWATSASA
jgi:hypothetical protein